MTGMDEALASLRQSRPAIQLALFADLGTKMVLAQSYRRRQPQERLDLLTDAAAKAFAACPNRTEIIVQGCAELRIFIKLSGAEDEAILCIADPAADPAPLLEHLRGIRTRFDKAGAANG